VGLLASCSFLLDLPRKGRRTEDEMKKKGKDGKKKGKKSLWHINQTFNLGWKCLAKLLTKK